MATTDRGSNELFAKKAIQVKMRKVDTFLYLPCDCFEHLAHLGVLGALKLCDSLLKGHRKWKYFSSVAIITNTLRDLSQSLFATWRSLYGDSSAVARVKSLFPRCIAGRWGSIDETEQRMIHAEIPLLAKAIKSLFTTEPDLLENDKTKNSEPSADSAIDTLSLEETHLFKVRMGKWRRHTFEVLQDPLFDSLLQSMHRARRPWIHLSCFLKKKLPQDSERHLYWLVCGKAQKLYEEFSAMIFCPLEWILPVEC